VRVAARCGTIVTLTILLVTIGSGQMANLNGSIGFASSLIGTTEPDFIQLGYGPGSLSSVQAGIPVFSSGDSLWFLSSSSLIISAQLVSPGGITKASSAISESTVSRLYTFSAADQEGNWTLKLTFMNSTMMSIAIPFVNPAAHQIEPTMSSFSIQNGHVQVGFNISPSQAFNLEGCLVSNDTNSTVEIPLPTSIGRAEMLINGNLHNANLTVKGPTSQPFSFWYELDYSYSYAGNVTGELISREVPVFKSSTTFFVGSVSRAATLANDTAPRQGKYELSAYFNSASGLFVEQTSMLLLQDGKWLWTGGCNTTQISSLSFTEQSSLTTSPNKWPTTFYLTYDVEGIDAYSALDLNLNQTGIHFLGSIGSAALPFLSFMILSNPNVLASGEYNGEIYLIARNFPLSLQIVPTFGTESLQTQTVAINKPFTDNQVVVPVGALNVQVTNNSAPLADASIIADNGFGGKATATSGPGGIVILYLPSGSYNVTVSSDGSSISKASTISTGAESNLQFAFSSSSSLGFIPYLLISVFIIGFIINVWLWIIRPRRALI
jgi:hypothetical protein